MCDLSKVSDYDIGCEILRRAKQSEDIEAVVNERASSSWVVSAGRNEPLIGKGECLVVVFRGLY